MKFKDLYIIINFIKNASHPSVLVVLLILNVNLAWAKMCPINKKFLDETYSPKSIVLTDAEGHQMALSLITEYFKKQNDLTKTPEFNLFVDESSKNIISKNIIEQFPKSYAQILKYLKFKSKNKLGYFNWQQDFMHAEFDEKSGEPILRFAKEYFDTGLVTNYDLQAYANFINPNSIIGDYFDRDKSSSFASEGGNIESGPAGTCLFGYAHKTPTDTSFTEQFCSIERSIFLDASYAGNAHVDEIVKSIPNLKPKVGECDSALIVNSPEKALEILQNNPKASFFNKKFSIDPEYKFWNIKSLSDYVNNNDALVDICERWQHSDERLSNDKNFLFPLDIQEMKLIWGKKSNYPASVRIRMDGLLKEPLNTKLIEWFNGWFSDFQNFKDYSYCLNITNQDVLDILNIKKNGVSLLDQNLKVITQVNSNILKINKKVEKICKPKIILVPALYWSDLKTITPSDTTRHMISPNLVNGLSIDNIYASPQTPILQFQDSLEQQLLDINIKTIFVNTLRPSVLNGELHCSSQVLRSCTPR